MPSAAHAPITPTSVRAATLGAEGKPIAAAVQAVVHKPAIDSAWIGVEVHTARHEDTLIDLAVAHGLGFIEVAMANPGVDPWLPGEGTVIVLPKMHLPPDVRREGIVINLSEQRLFYYERGELIQSFPIGIGRDGHSTPTGGTTIVRKAANPTWYPTPSARADDPTLPAAVPPGPDNPLGNRAMYLGWGSYLIHGTNKDYGIGRRASRGCIRMYPDDVAALFDRVAIGTPVTVVDQPAKVASLNGELYLEASPTVAQVRQWEVDGKFDPAESSVARVLLLKAAAADAERIDWSEFDRVMQERLGIPTRVTRPALPTAVASGKLSSGGPVVIATPRAVSSSASSNATKTAVRSGIAAAPIPAAGSLSTPSAAGRSVLPPPVRAAAGSASEDENPMDLVRWLRSRLGSDDDIHGDRAR